MSEPVIIIALQGVGKSLNAAQLMSALGCSRVVEEWNGQTPLQPGDMALTCLDVPDLGMNYRVLSFTEAEALRWQAA